MMRNSKTRVQEQPSLEPRPAQVNRRLSGHAEPGPERSVALDLLAGALAGAAAVWVMDLVHWFNYRRGLANERTRRQTRRARPRGMDPAHVLAAQATEAAGTELRLMGNPVAGQPTPSVPEQNMAGEDHGEAGDSAKRG